MKRIDFQNGTTKVNEDTFNQFQNNIEMAISDITSKKATMHITADTAKGANVTIPLKYKVGTYSLDVFWNGEKLIACSTYDDSLTGHYSEVGDKNSTSTTIKLTSDWNLEKGDYLEIITRGVYD